MGEWVQCKVEGCTQAYARIEHLGNNSQLVGLVPNRDKTELELIELVNLVQIDTQSHTRQGRSLLAKS